MSSLSGTHAFSLAAGLFSVGVWGRTGNQRRQQPFVLTTLHAELLGMTRVFQEFS